MVRVVLMLQYCFNERSAEMWISAESFLFITAVLLIDSGVAPDSRVGSPDTDRVTVTRTSCCSEKQRKWSEHETRRLILPKIFELENTHVVKHGVCWNIAITLAHA